MLLFFSPPGRPENGASRRCGGPVDSPAGFDAGSFYAPAVLTGPNAFVLAMDLNAAGSPASGAGDSATCAAAPILNGDATGRPNVRPGGKASCDIGAYESSETTPVTLQSFEVD